MNCWSLFFLYLAVNFATLIMLAQKILLVFDLEKGLILSLSVKGKKKLEGENSVLSPQDPSTSYANIRTGFMPKCFIVLGKSIILIDKWSKSIGKLFVKSLG